MEPVASEELRSDRQRAVLRSLWAAADLGVPEANQMASELGRQLGLCQRLAEAVGEVTKRRRPEAWPGKRPRWCQVDRWKQAPWRQSPREARHSMSFQSFCLLDRQSHFKTACRGGTPPCRPETAPRTDSPTAT